MNAASTTSPGARAAASRVPLFQRRHAPEVALGLGVLLVAAIAASLGVRITGWALDETIFKQSALHYASGFPDALFSDPTARATSRAYPLLLTPLVAWFDGDTAIRTARALNGLLFASAAIPTYLLARRVLHGRWSAVAAGLLAVACPWLTIATALYQENLAYPVFLWALLAMVRAVERRAMTADLAAVVMIALATTVRVQLAFVLAGWVTAVWIIAASEARGRGRARIAGALRGGWRLAPVTQVVVLAGVALMAWRAFEDQFRTDFRKVLGSYSEIRDRPTLSPDVGPALLTEVAAFALPGVLIAGGAALAWYFVTLRDGKSRDHWRFAVVAVAVGGWLWVLTAYVQGGFLADRTEERYYLYTFPLLWIGALAFAQDRAFRAAELVTAAGVLLLVVAAVAFPRGLDPEATFLTPASASVDHLLGRAIDALGLEGMTRRDGALIAGLGMVVASGWALHRFPRARWIVLLAVPAATQLGLGAFAFAARAGDVPGVPGATGLDFRALNWVDRAVDENETVTWLNNQRTPIGESAKWGQLGELFWNDAVRAWAEDPALRLPRVSSPMDALTLFPLAVDAPTGAVAGAERLRWVAQTGDAAFIQMAGRRRAQKGEYELIEPSSPPRVRWYQRGLDIDGAVIAGRPARLYAFARGARRRLRVDFTLLATADAPTQLTITLAGERRELDLEAGSTRAAAFQGCAPGGRLTGTATATQSATLPDGRPVGGSLVQVAVRDLGACR